MTVINHWGVWIDSEKPTTGVLSIHELAWETIDEVCLTCMEIEKDIEDMQDCPDCDVLLINDGECPNCDWTKQNEYDYIECDSSHEKIIGDWKKDKDGLYEPDIEKENGDGFAAIIRETTIQVVWSKWTTKGNPCSPCFPGQISIGRYETGDFLAFDLPDWAKFNGGYFLDIEKEIDTESN